MDKPTTEADDELQKEYESEARYLIKRFKKLPQEFQQDIWLDWGDVMKGYAQRQSQKYGLEIASDYLEAAQELRDNWGKMQGLSSGYPSLDYLTKGFVNGELIIIGGATSNGKTSLAVNIAAKVLSQGHSVLFVTMEMTKAQLTSRMMFVNDGFANDSALLAYQKNEHLNWKDVSGLITKAKKELGIELVIVDHLHHFTRELNNVAEDLGRITKEFQATAHELEIPIIVISHTRKGAGDNIEDLRGSSYIAQDADIVLMVRRNEKNPAFIDVLLVKNRNRGIDFQRNQVAFNFDATKITEIYDTDPFEAIPYAGL